MAIGIHGELKALAGDRPAGYLSSDLIQMMTIKRTVVAIAKIIGVEIPAGQQLLSASVDSADFTKPPLQSATLVKYANALPNEIGLRLNSDLTVKIRVFVKGDKAKLISIVTVVVTGLMIRGAYANNIISFEGLDFSSKPTVVRDPDADKTLQAAGIEPLEAARVEGLIEYSSVNNSLGHSLAQRKELPLSDVFPAFDFGTDADLVPLEQGQFLGIIPKNFSIRETAACSCASGPDLPVSGSSNTITVPANPQVGTPLGGVTIGGPVPEKLDPLKDLGSRFRGQGLAGVYLPKSSYTALTVQVMPAIAIHAAENGFIGFDAHASVGFSGANATLDAKNGGILVTVHMDINVSATCTLDIGCGIRLPIGYAIISQAVGSDAHLTMGFYPAVDQSGMVKLVAVLQDVDMGKYAAVILGIGTALKIIGVTAWIGFLIDVVLSAIVSYNLPFALRDEVKKYLGRNEWKLFTFGELINSTYTPPQVKIKGYTAPFDVDNDSMLASISYRQE